MNIYYFFFFFLMKNGTLIRKVFEGKNEQTDKSWNNNL